MRNFRDEFHEIQKTMECQRLAIATPQRVRNLGKPRAASTHDYDSMQSPLAQNWKSHNDENCAYRRDIREFLYIPCAAIHHLWNPVPNRVDIVIFQENTHSYE